jgi:hypothetical protein
MKLHRLVFGLCFAALLSACGGGDSTPATGPVTSTLSFPLKSAYSTLVEKGYTKKYVVSGSCEGFASEITAPATGGQTFEGVPVPWSTALTLAITWTTCARPSITATVTAYYDANYTPLGFSSNGVYSVYLLLPPPSIPASIMVGDTGTIGTTADFTDSSKITLAGKTVVSYVVEPDTASTAIVNLIFQTFDTSGNLTSTEQDRYRISSTGALTQVSKDTLTATTHLLLQ